MPSTVLPLLAIEAPLAALVFAASWALCLRVNNYGFLDVTWTLAIGILAAIDCFAGAGLPVRRWVFGLVGAAWSLRLGLFVLLRVLAHHPQEDKRYATLRQRWSSPAAFLMFFQLQAAIALAFSVPFLLASRARQSPVGTVEWLGLLIATAGLLGEALADRQAAAFKRHRGGVPVLDTGLWRYSRHPNYFFELVYWIGIALATVSLPSGWIALSAPALIGYFLLRVTGIPLTEKHALETHGEAYREYQRRTSALVPFPRHHGD